MRILMLSQFYPPAIGGEEQIARAMSVELAARGHEVAVATQWTEGLAEREVVDGVTIYRLRGTARRARWLYADTARPHAPPLPDPELTLGLRRVVRATRPQVVHAHNWLVHSFLPLKASSSAKLVLSLHDFSLTCATKKLIDHERYDLPCDGPAPLKCLSCAGQHYGRLKGAVTATANLAMSRVERRLVDMFLPVSQATAAGIGLVGSGLPYKVLPNFLPARPAHHDDLDRYIAQLPREPFVLFAGASGAYKGVDILLRAYADLPGAPPLVLLGYRTSEYAAGALPLPPNVVAFSDWPHAAVAEAWARCLFAVMPSRCAETFGLVALEAMQAGRPVVASRIGGLPEVVSDGECGLLVPPGDVDALRDAMRRLLIDQVLRARMGDTARQRAAQFSADVVVPRLERIYRALLEPGRDGQP